MTFDHVPEILYVMKRLSHDRLISSIAVLRHIFVCGIRSPSWIKCNLKCVGYGFESSLAGYLDKSSLRWRGRPGT